MLRWKLPCEEMSTSFSGSTPGSSVRTTRSPHGNPRPEAPRLGLPGRQSLPSVVGEAQVGVLPAAGTEVVHGQLGRATGGRAGPPAVRGRGGRWDLARTAAFHLRPDIRADPRGRFPR